MFNVTTAAVAVVSHERAAVRLESTYAALVAHYNIDANTASQDLTDTAREIVLIGANNDGTVTGAKITADMLTGRDPGADAGTVRDYWKSARRVRIGLVRAIKSITGDDDTTEPDVTDYLAKIIAAIDNGVSHNLNAADIKRAVDAHVDALLS